jgi:hypothetical protein
LRERKKRKSRGSVSERKRKRKQKREQFCVISGRKIKRGKNEGTTERQ